MSVIMDVSAIYYAALMNNELKQLFNTQVINDKRGKDIEWSDRSCFHKFARAIYKSIRAIYVAAFYYLVPFTSILFPFFLVF